MPDPGVDAPTPGVRAFYTRSPRFAFLRALIEANSDLDYSPGDMARVFRAVDERCAEIFPTEHRGGWFSPIFLGGTAVSHTPPHMVFAAYAIYCDLLAASPEPVPFLSQPLVRPGTSAILLEPGEGFRVETSQREAAPLTDFLTVYPATMQDAWAKDMYGTPDLNAGVAKVGCHGAAESLPDAVFGCMVLVHEPTRMVVNPWAAVFTPEEEERCFQTPVDYRRLVRYRDRITELLGVPADVLEHNHRTAKRVLDAYLARFPQERPDPPL